VSQQITIQGYIWNTLPPEVSRGLLCLGTAPRSGPTPADLRLKSVNVLIDLWDAIDPELLKRDAHLVIVANYRERDGMLPEFSATYVGPFDGRECSDFSDWYGEDGKAFHPVKTA
jgi:hypothetical protein